MVGAALALLAMAGGAARAEDVKALKPQGYVSDFAGVVSAGERERLAEYCGAVERATGAQMALVTIKTLNGAPIEDFSNDLFRQWGVGKKGTNEGVLLLLVIGDRKMRVEVGYGLEPILPDGFVGATQRQMRPALRARRYGEALMQGARTMGEAIAKAKNVDLSGAPEPAQRRRPESQPSFHIPVGAIIVVIVLLLLLGRRGGGGGGFLTGMILGSLFGGGRRGPWDGGGGWGGGGFGGGGGGGGGFGGFGGGDSGGGGASSDW